MSEELKKFIKEKIEEERDLINSMKQQQSGHGTKEYDELMELISKMYHKNEVIYHFPIAINNSYFTFQLISCI